jgi:hypothetical protein
MPAMIPCAVGPMTTGFPSLPVAGPTVAGRRFRFQFTTCEAGAARVRRRLAVAEYVDGWVPLRIVGEHMQRRRCWVWVETQRPVTADAADDYVRGCPGYVPGSFRMLG